MIPPDSGRIAGPGTRDGAAGVSLPGLLAVFLKIGAIGFGGGMAVVALMEREFVRRRRLIPLDEFLHGVGLGQVLGSFAVNAAAFVGYRMFGLAGALLSTAAFLAPPAGLVILLSALYFRYHAVPALQSAVAGLGPVVIALILSAAWSIGRRTLRSWPTALTAAGALAGGAAHWNPVWILLAAGAAGFFLPVDRARRGGPPPAGPARAGRFPALLAMPVAPAAPLPTLATAFLKIGLVFLGGGFALIPVLHHHLVSQWGWLKPREFLDGVAISNLTPGPIAVLATFTGYHLAGVAGAIVATAALFAPSIVLMLLFSYQYERLRHDRRAERFLAGVNPAVTGLIVSAAVLLGPGALASWRGCGLLAAALALLSLCKWPPAFVLAIGAAAGYFGWLP